MSCDVALENSACRPRKQEDHLGDMTCRAISSRGSWFILTLDQEFQRTHLFSCGCLLVYKRIDERITS